MSPSQEWFRTYSQLLLVSFSGSARIKHAAAKGHARESQILDLLRDSLPTRFGLDTNVVICDASGSQSNSFDGAWVDRQEYPRFALSDTIIYPVEAVKSVIEVKSSLDARALRDIFSKTASLYDLRSNGRLDSYPTPTYAFAYSSGSSGLSYFDFVAEWIRAPHSSPKALCVLDRFVISMGDLDDRGTMTLGPNRVFSVPHLFSSAEDSLLLFVYIICGWLTTSKAASDALNSYGSEFFSRSRGFHFEPDFLTEIQNDTEALGKARECFVGSEFDSLEERYQTARGVLGLRTS